MAHSGQLPVQPITGRTSFAAEVQLFVALLEPGYQAAHAHWLRADLSKEPNLASPATFRDCHGMPHLRNIQANENPAIFSHGSSSCA
jgi:hypothetical protein